ICLRAFQTNCWSSNSFGWAVCSRLSNCAGANISSSAGASRNLLSVLRVARFPAERIQLVPQFIAFPKIFCKPRLRPRLGQLRHFRGQLDAAAFKIERLVDSIPPTQPVGCIVCVGLVLVHIAIRLMTRLEPKTKCHRYVEIVIEGMFEFGSEGRHTGRRCERSPQGGVPTISRRASTKPLQPVVYPPERLA